MFTVAECRKHAVECTQLARTGCVDESEGYFICYGAQLGEAPQSGSVPGDATLHDLRAIAVCG
jgi:hypothetical protein